MTGDTSPDAAADRPAGSGPDGSGGGADARDPADTLVPEGATTHRCPYCDRPFRRDDQRTLHVGLSHYDRMTEAEEESFREVYAEEEAALRRYRLKLVGGLVLVYFGMLLLYAVVT